MTDGGTVNNVTVAGSIGGIHDVGGIAGGVLNAVFENIHNQADIVGENYIGGLIGNVNGGTSVIDATSSGNITGDYYVGGLVGHMVSSSIASSTSSSFVNATEDYVGGAVGLAMDTSEMVNTSSSGVVQGNSAVGGFVGGSYCQSSHYGNEATGDVVATGSSVGGYVGDDGCEGDGSSYVDTYATGDVTGASNVGGFIGQAFSSTLEKTYALGSVVSPGGGYVGGLIGRTTGFDGYETVVTESFAVGDVSANGTSVGGLVGATNSDYNFFTDVFARGAVTGDGTVGGLLGYSNTGTTVTNAYATGLISSEDGNVGGLLGAGEGGTVFNSSFWDVDTTQMPNGGDGTPKTTQEMKDISTYTDESTEGLTQAWDFVDNPGDDESDDDTWFMASNENDGYPCLSWLTIECNFSTEDLNGDEIPDWQQPNVGGYTSGYTGKTVAIDVGEGCELTTDDMTSEAQLEVQDPAYEYENGLWDFEADCGEPGQTTTITLYYYDVDPSDLILRKYNRNTGGYFTIEDASISSQTINNHSVAVVTYQITDNGELDMNPDDGMIADPAGLASQVVAAPNTGLGGRQF